MSEAAALPTVAPSPALLPVPTHLRSRLLYTNPVCLLATWSPKRARHNVMTVTWLTPVDNAGTFVMSVNEARTSVGNLQEHPHFTLSVPVKGMEALVLAIGSCHGDAVDKFGTIPGLGALPMAALASTAPGRPSSAKRSRADARAVEDSVPASPCAAACDHGVYVAGCVAVMSCSVRDVRPISGHLLCTCVVDAGFVDPRYWDGGKMFRPVDAGVAPYLTFFGSQQFGHVVRGEEAPPPGPPPA